MNALVLGLGGTVNQGIVKALRAGALPCRVVGACLSPRSAGLWLCDVALLSPPAADERFFPWLVDACRKEAIDVVLSGVDAVLAAIAPRAGELRERTGAVAVVSSPAALAVAGDKLATARWLEARGLPHPRTAPADDRDAVERLVAAVGYPLVAKPRCGRGSQGVLRVEDAHDLAYALRRPGSVVQEHVGDAAEEYTAGCFCAPEGEVLGTVVLRRELEAGCTLRGEVVERPDLAAAAAAVAAGLGALGPCNVQLRLRRGEPVCFDVNLRFSSTTPMRARLGFAEVEAAVRRFARGEPVAALLRPRPGIALRYWEEIYVRPEAVRELAAGGRLEAPRGALLPPPPAAAPGGEDGPGEDAPAPSRGSGCG